MAQSSSVVGGGELEREQLLLGDGTEVTIRSGVRDAEQRVSPLDDVIAEHALALVDRPRQQAGGTRHAHPELAVVWDLHPLVQRPLQDGLVGAHLQRAGLALVLDGDFVGGGGEGEQVGFEVEGAEGHFGDIGGGGVGF